MFRFSTRIWEKSIHYKERNHSGKAICEGAYIAICPWTRDKIFVCYGVEKRKTCIRFGSSVAWLLIGMISFSLTIPEDFRRPGHMFPLLAKKNGVLERNGHTEAMVNLWQNLHQYTHDQADDHKDIKGNSSQLVIWALFIYWTFFPGFDFFPVTI